MGEKCMEVCGLTKSFHGKKVVDALSFSVKKGQVFGLLGHNGAGKSTTIEMLLGLKKPDDGNAWIFVYVRLTDLWENKFSECDSCYHWLNGL